MRQSIDFKMKQCMKMLLFLDNDLLSVRENVFPGCFVVI